MSKCAEPGTFELEVLIEENEDFGTAFEKTRSRVLKALLAEIKERFGYSPEVCKTRLLEEFFCENTIDWASDVLGTKSLGWIGNVLIRLGRLMSPKNAGSG